MDSVKKRFLRIISLLLFLVVFLSSCKSSNNTIKIATKPMTEQFILGEMIAALIENDLNLNVSLDKGIGGGTSNIHPSMLKGGFDIYPEYTSTAWNHVLKRTEIIDNDLMIKEISKTYQEQFNMEWLGYYGFNNTYGLAISKDLAQKKNIKTFSDLQKYSSELTFGSEYDFYEREDGYNSLKDTYGFNFKKVTDLDIGLKYKSLESGSVNVITVFTTDAQLHSDNVVVLEDDKKFFSDYYAGTVVRKEVLEKYTGLKESLMKLNNIISDAQMSELNYKVEVEKRDEKDVAIEFLKSKGLI